MSQVAYSATVRPVCLPATPDRSYEGEAAVATGWGKLGTGGFPQQLMEVRGGLNIYTLSTISTHYLQYLHIIYNIYTLSTQVRVEVISNQECRATWPGVQE